jgi:hypothetical protein
LLAETLLVTKLTSSPAIFNITAKFPNLVIYQSRVSKVGNHHGILFNIGPYGKMLIIKKVVTKLTSSPAIFNITAKFPFKCFCGLREVNF